MTQYTAGQAVILNDGRLCKVSMVLIASPTPSIAHYEVLVIVEDALINVHGNEIRGEIDDHRKLAVASQLRRNRALLLQTGLNSGNLLDELLAAVETPNPAVTYHQSTGLDNALDHVSVGSVSITSRSMFLDRFARLPGKKGQHTLRYGYLEGADNYVWCLNLSEAVLQSWNGKTLLDLGCGYSMFYAEASVLFGATVIPVDLQERDPAVEDQVVAQYVKNMSFLKALLEFSTPQACGMEAIDTGLFDKAFGRMGEIVAYYRNHRPRRVDVINGNLGTLQYVGVISCFMFCYFDDRLKTDALINICGHMQKPGWIKICTGMQGFSAETKGFSANVIQGVIQTLNQRGITMTAQENSEMVEFQVSAQSWLGSWFK